MQQREERRAMAGNSLSCVLFRVEERGNSLFCEVQLDPMGAQVVEITRGEGLVLNFLWFKNLRILSSLNGN
jgi:hypothetical protein